MKRILAAEMLLFIPFFEKEREASGEAKKNPKPWNHSLYCIQSKKPGQLTTARVCAEESVLSDLFCAASVQTDEVQIICSSEVCTSALLQLLCTELNIWGGGGADISFIKVSC